MQMRANGAPQKIGPNIFLYIIIFIDINVLDFRFMRNVMHEVHMSEWVLIHFKVINLKFSMKMD